MKNENVKEKQRTLQFFQKYVCCRRRRHRRRRHRCFCRCFRCFLSARWLTVFSLKHRLQMFTLLIVFSNPLFLLLLVSDRKLRFGNENYHSLFWNYQNVPFGTILGGFSVLSRHRYHFYLSDVPWQVGPGGHLITQAWETEILIITTPIFVFIRNFVPFVFKPSWSISVSSGLVFLPNWFSFRD